MSEEQFGNFILKKVNNLIVPGFHDFHVIFCFLTPIILAVLKPCQLLLIRHLSGKVPPWGGFLI